MKYKLTKNTKIVDGVTLHQIVCTRNIWGKACHISEGSSGGWVESEKNLSQNGTCWVDDNACVFGNAIISDDAIVADDAIVKDSAVVKDNATIMGQSKILNNSVICGKASCCVNSIVKNHAFISDALISKDAVICDNAHIEGKHSIYGTVRGDAIIKGNDGFKITKSAIVSGNAVLDTRSIFNHNNYNVIISDMVVDGATDLTIYPIPFSISKYFEIAKANFAVFSNKINGEIQAVSLFDAPCGKEKVFSDIITLLVFLQDKFKKSCSPLKNKSMNYLFRWLEENVYTHFWVINSMTKNFFYFICNNVPEKTKEELLKNQNTIFQKISLYIIARIISIYFYGIKAFSEEDPDEFISSTNIFYGNFLQEMIEEMNLDFNKQCLRLNSETLYYNKEMMDYINTIVKIPSTNEILTKMKFDPNGRELFADIVKETRK